MQRYTNLRVCICEYVCDYHQETLHLYICPAVSNRLYPCLKGIKHHRSHPMPFNTNPGLTWHISWPPTRICQDIGLSMCCYKREVFSFSSDTFRPLWGNEHRGVKERYMVDIPRFGWDINIRVCMCTHVYICVCMFICIYIYMRMHIPVHVCRHMHILRDPNFDRSCSTSLHYA